MELWKYFSLEMLLLVTAYSEESKQKSKHTLETRYHLSV